MDEALEAEFDTVARWTAEVAAEMGERYLIPAACRGSGTPAALEWLIDDLEITAADRMLDCGAGLGGPAAFAADLVGVRPILTDPEFGACQGATRLFGFPAVQAASDLPFRSDSFDLAWCLGVLCTVVDQPRLLSELRRVVTASGRLGLLVFVRTTSTLIDQPSGNNFPTVDGLEAMLGEARWSVTDRRSTADLPSGQAQWQDLAEAVDAELDRRHRNNPVWQTARAQSEAIGRLIGSGEVEGQLLIARQA